MTRSSRLRLGVFGALAVVLGVSSFSLIRRWRTSEEVPRLGPASTTLVPGVHLLCGLGPSAAYVVETRDGLVLVDTGLEADAGPLKEEMAKLGLDWKKIRAILLTHVHGDHTGGAEYLRVSVGAKVYAGRGDADALRAGGPREAFFSTFHMPNHRPHPTKVDVELDGDELITFGDVQFRALAMPGHTPGSICYLMERGNLRALFGGDVISMLEGDGNPHSTGLKPLGTYSAYLSPRYRGDGKTYLASLKKLRAMPVPDLVLPGHPSSDPTPQSPRLTEQQWNAMLDEGISDLKTLLAHHQDDGANFLDGQPKRLLPDLYYFGDFQGMASYGFFVGSKLFVVDAPGGTGFLDFLKASLKGLGRDPINPTAVLLTSGNAKDTAGLKELVERCHAQVVAPLTLVSAIKAICPPGTTVLSAKELPGKGWFPVTPIPLRGRGSAPMAYLIPWAGKTVLLSGRIPVQLDHDSIEALSSDLSASTENAIEYLLSIQQLEALKPDLWLPIVPSDDQNANLYDTDWKHIIANNYRAGRSILERRR